MGLFGRKKTPPPSPAAGGSTAVAGVPAEALASGDFEVVVRALASQMSGHPVVELGNDTIGVGDNKHYLGNMRAGWEKRPPGEREIWIRNAIHGFHKSELRNMDTLDTSMLRPGIRSQWTAKLMLLMAQEQSPGSLPDPSAVVANRVMADGIVRVLIWDTPTTMSLVNENQIVEWGADFDQLWDIAVANLANDAKSGGWAAANKTVWISLDEDDYCAERIFVDGHLDATSLGEHVVMFHPHRNIVILADLMDPEGIAIAAELAIQNMNKPNPVSLTPIVGRGLHWHPLQLAAGHPAAEKVAHLCAAEKAQTYGHQKQLLSNIHGEEIFVASYKAFGHPEHGITSVASWAETVDTLLPRTERIAFVAGINNPEPEIIQVPWATAEAVVGHRMEPTDHCPTRVRVQSFPDANELAALRALAID